MAPRLLEKFEKTILPELKNTLGRTNRHDLPKLQKIVCNIGVGKSSVDKKYMEEALSILKEVTGQKPAVCRARKSIAGFKLRQGMQIGCKVTLRGHRMYEFLDRLISVVLPRVRDFRGLSPNAFDGHGNYSLGFSEQSVFPELNPDKYTKTLGMNITLVSSGNSNDDSREMLRGFGMPFIRDEDPK